MKRFQDFQKVEWPAGQKTLVLTHNARLSAKVVEQRLQEGCRVQTNGFQIYVDGTVDLTWGTQDMLVIVTEEIIAKGVPK